ncbi:hypothetical protein MTsPCn5_18790 [Croceitalea sp. MTPC5]|uniref:hypothetical protein n=1 Tax=Croceitalea sp. MTPC5 TaxID=3056565 RepID=UPI002B36F1E1|nr:hypothetical protein MTsPCn5_18790 [Croceitalea sp. MTPC5]
MQHKLEVFYFDFQRFMFYYQVKPTLSADKRNRDLILFSILRASQLWFILGEVKVLEVTAFEFIRPYLY